MSNQQSKTCFYLLRHGETEWNVEKILQGQQDSPLTDNGIKQAQQRAKDLATVKFDRCFSSDLMRAHKTAEIIAAERQSAILSTKLLRETSFGKYEGLKTHEFRRQLQESISQANKLRGQARLDFKLDKEVESLEETAQRALRFMRETALAYPGETILAVSHSNVLRSILIKLAWIEDMSFGQVEINNLAYVILETDGLDFFIKGTKGIEVVE